MGIKLTYYSSFYCKSLPILDLVNAPDPDLYGKLILNIFESSHGLFDIPELA
jgi:hypothetical protein